VHWNPNPSPATESASFSCEIDGRLDPSPLPPVSTTLTPDDTVVEDGVDPIPWETGNAYEVEKNGTVEERAVDVDASHSTSERVRTRRIQRTLAWTVAGVGAAGWTAAAACLVIVIAEWVTMLAGAMMPSRVVSLAVVWPVLLLVAGVLFVPSALRSLGIHVRTRTPIALRQRFAMRSLADHQRVLRNVMIVSVVLTLLVVLIGGLAARLETRLFSGAGSSSLPSDGWFSSIGIEALLFVLFLLAGGLINALSLGIYRRNNARALRRGLRAHHRGVALRSFIPAWDSPLRDIYRSCRLSKRLAHVHRTFSIATIGCFAAAACWAAAISTNSFIGECLAVVAMIAVAAQWPTSQRIVAWSGKMIDPFCEDQDEYEEY